jgi:hypothetical protein
MYRIAFSSAHCVRHQYDDEGWQNRQRGRYFHPGLTGTGQNFKLRRPPFTLKHFGNPANQETAYSQPLASGTLIALWFVHEE